MDFRSLLPHWLQGIGFRLAGPHIRFKKLRTVSSHHPLPSCCNSVGSVLLYSFCFELFSGGLWRFGSAVVPVFGQDRPHNSGIFVGKGHCNYIWVSPFTHPVDPDASGVLFSTSFAKNSSGSVDQKRTQVPITALTDPKQSRLPPLDLCLGTSPSHAANWRPFLKQDCSPTAATSAVAGIGPIPSTFPMR